MKTAFLKNLLPEGGYLKNHRYGNEIAEMTIKIEMTTSVNDESMKSWGKNDRKEITIGKLRLAKQFTISNFDSRRQPSFTHSMASFELRHACFSACL